MDNKIQCGSPSITVHLVDWDAPHANRSATATSSRVGPPPAAATIGPNATKIAAAPQNRLNTRPLDASKLKNVRQIATAAPTQASDNEAAPHPRNVASWPNAI